MNCSNRVPRQNDQGGFTLVEILIALGVLSLIMATTFPALNAMLTWGQQNKTHARLEQVANVLRSAYENHAMMVDTQTSGQRFCAAGSLSKCLENGSTRHVDPSAVSPSSALGSNTAYALSKIAESQGVNVNRLEVDGFQKYFHFFVSKELKKQVCSNCLPVYYHVIAIVSSGGKNNLSSKTHFDANTGKLTLSKKDQGVVISGLPIERADYKQTKKQLRRIADDYGQFFTSRYLSSTSRNPSKDYFSKYDNADAINSQSYDNNSPICNSGNYNCGWNHNGVPYPGKYGTPITNTSYDFWDCQPATRLGGFMQSLGLSKQDVITAWGYPIIVCNGPNSPGMGGELTRNPSSGNGALRNPPYTADIVAFAPNHVPLFASVEGQY